MTKANNKITKTIIKMKTNL